MGVYRVAQPFDSDLLSDALEHKLAALPADEGGESTAAVAFVARKAIDETARSPDVAKVASLMPCDVVGDVLLLVVLGVEPNVLTCDSDSHFFSLHLIRPQAILAGVAKTTLRSVCSMDANPRSLPRSSMTAPPDDPSDAVALT